MPLLASHARIAIAFVHHAGKPPPFRATLLRNTLLPGTAQIALGHVSEGRLLLAGSFSLGIALHRVLAVGGASGAISMSSPHRGENVFNFDFFPFFPPTILGQIGPDDIALYGEFFGRDRVDFWGLEVSPWAGLALNTLFSFGLVHANATAEEIIYRGLLLEQRGVVRSSLSFGAAHLPNMLIPGVSVEDTLYQTLFAGIFGFYAANRAEANGFDFSRMVALHFWHNVFAFTAAYLEKQALPAMTWSVSLSY